MNAFCLLPLAFKCTGFPGPGLEHTSPRVLFNPMSEYINRHGEEHFQSSYEQFKKTHGLKYDSEHEHHERMKIFRNNVRYINTGNRAALPYKMKINKFADRTVSQTKKNMMMMWISSCINFDKNRMMNYVRFVVDDIRKVIMVVCLFPKKNCIKTSTIFPTVSIGVLWELLHPWKIRAFVVPVGLLVRLAQLKVLILLK